MRGRRITGIVTAMIGVIALAADLIIQWDAWGSHLLMYGSILTHLPSSLIGLPAQAWLTPLPPILAIIVTVCGVLLAVTAGRGPETPRHSARGAAEGNTGQDDGKGDE